MQRFRVECNFGSKYFDDIFLAGISINVYKETYRWNYGR